ncbi:hypothetical protein OQA88_7037 [Cercophora sp. LCS_1]
MYSHLDSNRRETRLVAIKPGSRNDDIRCGLIQISLSDLPQYEALSYVWGDPSDRTMIVLDGQDFSVTKNLSIALGYLRRASEERVMWIDAICINQSDTEERSAQVVLMADIYRGASRVVSWIGEEDDELDASKARYFMYHAAANDFSDDWVMSSILEGEEKHMMRRCLLHLSNLLSPKSRTYWTRTWITQEIALAQNGILQCSEVVISFEDLRRLFNTFDRIFWSNSAPLALKVMRDGGVDALLAMRAVLGWLHNHEIDKRQSVDAPLLQLLIENHEKLSTDPLDKVYGVLGLVDEPSRLHPGVKVNYGRTIRDVYMGVVQTIVETTAKLDVLCVSYPEIDERLIPRFGARRTDLPSWVPDWSQWTGPLIQSDTKRSIKGTAGESPASVSFQMEEGIMSAAGFRVGTISVCGDENPVRDSPPSHDPEYYADIFSVVQSWHSLLSSAPGYRSAHEALFFNTLIFGTDGNWPATMDRIKSTSEDTSLHRAAILESIQDGCEGKTFFLINTDAQDAVVNMDSPPKMGIACSGVRGGDLVCVLLGCFLPVVLRPYDGYFKFVSGAYVHALMNGAGIDGLECGEYDLDIFDLI